SGIFQFTLTEEIARAVGSAVSDFPHAEVDIRGAEIGEVARPGPQPTVVKVIRWRSLADHQSIGRAVGNLNQLNAGIHIDTAVLTAILRELVSPIDGQIGRE